VAGERGARRLRIGVSTYSFWHFKGPRPEVADLIDTAGRMGFDGVEILHEMMSSESNGYLQELKHRAFVNGLDLMGFSIQQGFVSPDPAVRQQNIDHTIHCIELAYKLGTPPCASTPDGGGPSRTSMTSWPTGHRAHPPRPHR